MQHTHHSYQPGLALAAALAVSLALLAPATAQQTIQVEQPTQGLHLPAIPLAGEHDAFSVATNPAGLRFLRGPHLGLGVDIAAEDQAILPAPGVGLYAAGTIGGGILPRLGLGLGLEVLRPPRADLTPDPGEPLRLTLAYALPLGRSAAWGMSYHHFFDDPGSTLGGVSTWDMGLAMRLGARFALGATLRDLATPTVDSAEVERRYELELISRPLATDRLELALGGRLAEESKDLDGWLRLSARVARGLYLDAEVGSRELAFIDMTPTGTTERSERELTATAGLRVSFGSLGAAFYATGGRSADGDQRLAGSTLLVRAGAAHIPSVLGRPRRIERVELSGEIGQRALTSLTLRLRAIARDPQVVAVLVPIDDIDAGWATVQELRAELLRVRRAGKKVFTYMVAASTRDYYLATAADQIYLDPAGGIRLVGLAGTSLYFKGLFAKLGVSAQFEKIEEYKSAPEAWTRMWPSEPARMVRNAIYDSLYINVVEAIADSRGLSANTLRQLIDGGPYTAGDDAVFKLVDVVATPEQVSKLVPKELGGSYPMAAAPRERPSRWSMPAIAVIYIDGDIVDGKSQTIPVLGRKLVGGETIAQAIAAARMNPRVEAIVLRIDSPGGSALASELMAREVFKTRGVKPIICSMGDVAASGGYFAAAGCDVIFAEPTTITGSIGIFYGKFDLSNLMTRLGLTWTTTKRGARADMESYFRPYTAEERAHLKDKLRYLYGRFIGAVARGRGITKDQVDAVARGRVWTGAQAQEVGLVDQLGGLADAIAFAKARVGLGDDDRVRVVQLPAASTSLLDYVLGGAAGRADAGAVPLWLPGGAALLEAIPASVWAQPDVPQARLPFAIVWH